MRLWGSVVFRSHLLAIDGQIPESARTPAVAAWLEDVALRDLTLHQEHAACIDAKGDVYQWGDGFFGRTDSSERPSSCGKPKLTLRGKVGTLIALTRARRLTAYPEYIQTAE